MTDNYGNDQHEHDLGHDEMPVESEAIETPSEFEFSDEPGEEQPHQASNAARSPILPIVAAVGGLALLGTVAWWMFSGPSSSPPAMPRDSATMTVEPSLPGTVSPKQAAPAPQETMNAPVATKSNAATASPAPAVVPANNDFAAPAPVKPAPVQVEAPTPAPTPTPTATTTTATVSENNETTRKIETLNARIDELQKALEQSNQQLAQVANLAAASASNANNAPAPAAASKEVEDKLAKMEQELTDLRKARQAAPSLAAPTAFPAESVTPAPATHHHETAKHPIKPAAEHKKTPKKTAEKTVAKIEKTTITWSLRAASPGQAWVAPTPVSRDLQQVHVGDTLTGVGRVTAIQQQGDKWIVVGTKGRIE